MIVIKFGGTSVEEASAIERLCEIVRERQRQHPVVVVSALAKVTDALLKAASLAAAADDSAMLRLLNELQVRHQSVSRELLADPAAVVTKVRQFFDELRTVLNVAT